MHRSPIGCAVGEDSRLHICLIAKDGRLYHTYRESGGAWPNIFGDVRTAVGPRGNDLPSPLGDVSCTYNHSNGYLAVCDGLER